MLCCQNQAQGNLKVQRSFGSQLLNVPTQPMTVTCQDRWSSAAGFGQPSSKSFVETSHCLEKRDTLCFCLRSGVNSTVTVTPGGVAVLTSVICVVPSLLFVPRVALKLYRLTYSHSLRPSILQESWLPCALTPRKHVHICLFDAYRVKGAGHRHLFLNTCKYRLLLARSFLLCSSFRLQDTCGLTCAASSRLSWMSNG
jgi:hypothetical protein